MHWDVLSVRDSKEGRSYETAGVPAARKGVLG